jgi:aspartyl-tRNA(Asn)/glutamyl-tRNA(Gln) amidotransferase subunit A
MTAVRDGELETAREMVAALRAGSVTPGELNERAQARARAWQPSILAFSQLWSEPEAADPEGPFGGVPVAVKDLFDVAGRETTGCCRAYAGRVAARDAPAVAALRSAGLTIVGKTNQHELALGGTNRYSACGRPGNPWDPARLTGGSSGGSAAAVAAGIVPFALGSDTGGSIRIPSSFCGTFGLKVTTGSVTIDGMLPLAPSLDTPGPLAATAGDLRAIYRVLAGGSAEEVGAPVAAAARGVRLGLVGGYYAQHIHPEVAAGVERVCAEFEAIGAAVDPVDGSGIVPGRSGDGRGRTRGRGPPPRRDRRMVRRTPSRARCPGRSHHRVPRAAPGGHGVGRRSRGRDRSRPCGARMVHVSGEPRGTPGPDHARRA